MSRTVHNRFTAVFRSLRVFNYRVWATGSLVSNVGSWMQRTAQDWLVFTQLTHHDASAVGVVMALQFGPQPYGHCYASGTAVYGDGTSVATVSHPDSTRWIFALPPGSKGRLFRNQNGDATAVNLGLYYLSVRMEVGR